MDNFNRRYTLFLAFSVSFSCGYNIDKKMQNTDTAKASLYKFIESDSVFETGLQENKKNDKCLNCQQTKCICYTGSYLDNLFRLDIKVKLLCFGYMRKFDKHIIDLSSLIFNYTYIPPLSIYETCETVLKLYHKKGNHIDLIKTISMANQKKNEDDITKTFNFFNFVLYDYGGCFEAYDFDNNKSFSGNVEVAPWILFFNNCKNELCGVDIYKSNKLINFHKNIIEDIRYPFGNDIGVIEIEEAGQQYALVKTKDKDINKSKFVDIDNYGHPQIKFIWNELYKKIGFESDLLFTKNFIIILNNTSLIVINGATSDIHWDLSGQNENYDWQKIAIGIIDYQKNIFAINYQDIPLITIPNSINRPSLIIYDLNQKKTSQKCFFHHNYISDFKSINKHFFVTQDEQDNFGIWNKTTFGLCEKFNMVKETKLNLYDLQFTM